MPIHNPPPSMPTVEGWSFDEVLTPTEVAQLMRVNPKTVSRWANDGRLVSIMTLGGHRRYSGQQIRALMRGESSPPPAPETNADAQEMNPS